MTQMVEIIEKIALAFPQKQDVEVAQWRGDIGETKSGSQNHAHTLTPSLPVALSPTQRAVVKPAQKVPALDILVADDNVVNQKVVLHMLKRVGYQADVVGDGMEVLDALQQKSYDIVLMDIQMPRMDGITATKTIKSRFPSEQQPCIIAVTANAMPGDRERCLDAGMDDYISKPVRLEKLVAALDKATPRQAISNNPASSNGSGHHNPNGDNQDSDEPIEEPYMEAIPDVEQFPPVDIATFEEMVGPDSLDFLIELLEAFLIEMPKQLTELHGAIDTQDILVVRRISHSLTGNSGGLAAHDLTQIARSLENQAREDDLTQARDKIRQMERELIRLQRWLKRMTP